MPRVAVVLVPLTVALAAATTTTSGDTGKFWAMALGVVVGFWFHLVDAVPEHIARWERGADGERRTAAALRRLPRSDWTVVHDLDTGAGNVDHLLIGPGGPVLLETKTWTGVVTVHDQGVRITPREQPDKPWTERDLVRRLPAQARTVARALSRAAGQTVPAPRCVVVVWAPFPAGIAHAGAVTYVSGPRLVDWLVADAGSRPLHRAGLAALHRAATGDLLAPPQQPQPAHATTTG